MLVLNMAHFLPAAGIGDEARVQFKQTIHALDEFMRKCFNEWTFSLESVSVLDLFKNYRFYFVLFLNFNHEKKIYY